MLILDNIFTAIMANNFYAVQFKFTYTVISLSMIGYIWESKSFLTEEYFQSFI